MPPDGLVTHQMELLHVGVNVVEHCKLLRRDLRREHSSADTADPSNPSDTSHHTADAATRRGHLLQHRARHLHVKGREVIARGSLREGSLTWGKIATFKLGNVWIQVFV